MHAVVHINAHGEARGQSWCPSLGAIQPSKHSRLDSEPRATCLDLPSSGRAVPPHLAFLPALGIEIRPGTLPTVVPLVPAPSHPLKEYEDHFRSKGS